MTRRSIFGAAAMFAAGAFNPFMRGSKLRQHFRRQRNSYRPHNGRAEIARRLKQIERNQLDYSASDRFCRAIAARLSRAQAGADQPGASA